MSPSGHPLSSSPVNPPLLKVQQDTDQRYDAATLREVFDIPCQHWKDIAETPYVRQALAAFPSELQTRPKGRLDLVSWVATISAFGVDGPSDDDWNKLFLACCFEPHKLCEAKIAVLLATAKCTADLPQDKNVTDHVLTKMRVRPAVEGRIQARAPGILLQVQRKYDQFLYTNVRKLLLEQAVREINPEAILFVNNAQGQQRPLNAGGHTSGLTAASFGAFGGSASASVGPAHGGTLPDDGNVGTLGDLAGLAASNILYPPPTHFNDPHQNLPFVGSTNPPFPFKAETIPTDAPGVGGRRFTGAFIRQVGETQVDAQMRVWETSMLRLLRLNPDSQQSNPRLRRFYIERELYRSHLRETVCNKLSMYVLDSQRYTE